MPAFHDIRFPTAIALGASGGPERRTRIVTLTSGHEERNTPWANSRRRYEAGYGVKTLDDLDTVVSFFEARRGRLHGFRWKDASDNKSCAPSQIPSHNDQILGRGDGITAYFQLVKDYISGDQRWQRPITKPLANSVQLAVDGQAVAADIDLLTGLVHFSTPPAPEAVVTAGYHFDVPVRFDTDRLDINLAGFEAGDIPSIPIIEIRG